MLAIALALLAAPPLSCSADPSPLADFGTSVAAAAAEVPAPVARLVFDGDWSERVEDAAGGPGLLFAGAPAVLDVSAERFAKCPGGVTAYVKDRATGEVTAIAMESHGDGRLRGNFTAPGEGVDVWFKASRPAYENLPACETWDSDFGRNYSIDSREYAPVRATFANGASSPSLDGALAAGGALVVDYDAERLPDCRTSYMGNPTWSIYAHVKVDGGPVTTKVVAGKIPYAGGPQAFAIPDGAKKVEMWFENVGHYPGNANPCRAWDSRNGANYTFTVE